MNPIILDERLSAAAELAREALAGREAPVAADVGCDHGFLTAKLLEIVPGLTMLASDVSAPSLEKARRLLGARGLSERANITVADGLSAVDRPVDAVMILGMGAGTILKNVAEGGVGGGGGVSVGAAVGTGVSATGTDVSSGCAAVWPSWALRFKRRSTAERRGGTTSRCWRGRARPKCRTSGG